MNIELLKEGLETRRAKQKIGYNTGLRMGLTVGEAALGELIDRFGEEMAINMIEGRDLGGIDTDRVSKDNR